MKRCKIVIPLEVWDDFEDDMTNEQIKEALANQLDALMVGTDFFEDYFKHAEVEEF